MDERSAITLDRVEQVSERLDDHLEAHRVEGRQLNLNPTRRLNWRMTMQQLEESDPDLSLRSMRCSEMTRRALP